MTDDGRRTLRDRIAAELGVAPHVDVEAEAARRVQFPADHLESSAAAGYVLGASGGVDRRPPPGWPATAPGEADAQRALEFIAPGEVVTVDIKPATDALFAEVTGGRPPADRAHKVRCR